MKCRLLILCAMSFSTNAEQIVVASDIWCPYICTDNSGYVVELTQQAFASVDVEVKFESIPFQRALTLTSQHKLDAVLAVTAEHIAAFSLSNNHMVIGQYTNDFYTPANSHWQYSDLESLDNKLIATILGYDYGESLNRYLENSQSHIRTSGEKPLKTNLYLATKERIDLLIGNRYVIDYTAKQYGYSENIRFAGSENESTALYVGFSNDDKGRSFATKFAQGIENLKQSGEYQVILDKYQIVF
ncbi:transporter substrate-binding domain-containing protein [Shewanella sp. Isolate13]|uniref:substrate-binding periplasmic protein n=1 Tax=Shewanella sp. Isolate13 TaxID=2908531 RepID=UPI001EFE880D|nr:transporter substrate-binding domain-containing protein [Shewanella sp. Isolate13]MCG9728343.1 transporter substrate-binding domain-containing protein [Shewanella sp. Isolate13]